MSLKSILSTAARNARYTSAPIQNQLIECAGKIISNKLVEEINESGVFAILADESTDCSNKEQLVLIIRFVDKKNEIGEEFLQFIYMDSGVGREELKSKILGTLRDAGIDMSYCRGQGYDGAANMSGVRCGCASLITAEYHLAIYMHCACHKLNLVIQKTHSVQMVRNIMDTIKKLSYSFNLSLKRQGALEKHVMTYYPEAKRTKLIDVCRTRWVARIDGMEVLQDLMPAVVASLEEMTFNKEKTYNSETSVTASSYLKAITCFQFIVCLVVSRRHVLNYSRPATVKLQMKERDILEGYKLIEVLRSTINHVINDVDHYHQLWYDEAFNLPTICNVEEKMPRIPQVSIYRDNPPAESQCLYYKYSLTLPPLNNLLTQLDERLKESSKPYRDAMKIIPDQVVVQ